MRPFALTLCLALAACGSETPAAPDASQVSDVAPADTSAPDAVVVDVPADTASDVAQVLDVTPDAAVDSARPDVGPADVAPDARSCGSAVTVECQINGHAECVNITTGRMQSDGTTLHCGACGVTCASGFACLARVCERL